MLKITDYPLQDDESLEMLNNNITRFIIHYYIIISSFLCEKLINRSYFNRLSLDFLGIAYCMKEIA